MPILFIALLALLLFLVMGGMVFYAAYAESHTPHPGETRYAGAPVGKSCASLENVTQLTPGCIDTKL